MVIILKNKLVIDENTNVFANLNGKLKMIKKGEDIDKICENIIKGYKERKEKNIIYCIQKENFVCFINSHFKSKSDLKKAKRSLEKENFVVMVYNG